MNFSLKHNQGLLLLQQLHQKIMVFEVLKHGLGSGEIFNKKKIIFVSTSFLKSMFLLLLS